MHGDRVERIQSRGSQLAGRMAALLDGRSNIYSCGVFHDGAEAVRTDRSTIGLAVSVLYEGSTALLLRIVQDADPG